MPELPEVETVRLQLLHKVVGKTIKSVTVYHNKSADHNPDYGKKLKRKTIEHIDRIGKLLIVSFSGEPDLFLLAHLKMTGQFFYVSGASVSGGGHSLTPADSYNLPNKHTRIAFHFTDNTILYFNDMRLFGYVKIATAAEMTVARSGYGPEPITNSFDVPSFTKALKRRSTPIKAALLDQSLIAGLGNIYVDETLFAAKIRPMRKANTVTKKEIATIVMYSGSIMNKAISVGGTTFQHFADTGGDKGNYTDYLQVFGKQKTNCPICGSLIVKTRVAGRGTHYCPTCQK